MKKLLAALCFMFAVSPLAMAQDKAKADDKKATPAPAVEKKAAAAPATAAPSAAEKKAASAPKAEKKTAKAKKEPSEKQLAQRAKMKSCSKDASDKKMKGNDRKKFMSGCMKA